MRLAAAILAVLGLLLVGLSLLRVAKGRTRRGWGGVLVGVGYLVVAWGLTVPVRSRVTAFGLAGLGIALVGFVLQRWSGASGR